MEIACDNYAYQRMKVPSLDPLEQERVMAEKRSKESVAVYMMLMGMKAAGRIEEDAAEQLDQIMEEAFTALEARLSKMDEALNLIAENGEAMDGHDFDCAWYAEYCSVQATKALAGMDDLSKLTTQQKPTEEAMEEA